jgi:hypothetical protein
MQQAVKIEHRLAWREIWETTAMAARWRRWSTKETAHPENITGATWQATANEAAISGKSPKQALVKWLREQAAEFGLTEDDGKPNETDWGLEGRVCGRSVISGTESEVVWARRATRYGIPARTYRIGEDRSRLVAVRDFGPAFDPIGSSGDNECARLRSALPQSSDVGGLYRHFAFGPKHVEFTLWAYDLLLSATRVCTLKLGNLLITQWYGSTPVRLFANKVVLRGRLMTTQARQSLRVIDDVFASIANLGSSRGNI